VSLQPSKLSDQLELLKDDLDLRSLNLAWQGKASLAILEHVTGATVARTIDGASTLTVTLRDRERSIWRNPAAIVGQVDTQIDGLWFRLKGYDKQGDDLTLTFEDREVALLRDYPKPFAKNRFISRPTSVTNRLKFAKWLVDEVKDIAGGIRFVTPDSFPALLQDNTLPVDKTAAKHARGYGFAPGSSITVKGKAASPAQRDVIDRVLQVGMSLEARRKVLVTAIMVITQESSATNLAGGDRDSKGVFQQRPSQGWPASGVVEIDAVAFFQPAISDYKKNPGIQDWQLGQDVQLSANGQLYAQWKTEAERTVDQWGATSDQTAYRGSTTTDKSHQFTRGTMTGAAGGKTFTREDNWACLQRLASEVNWRCFCVSGTVYFMPDLDLLASQPQMTLSEASEGVDSIDGSGDEGRQSIRKGHRVQQLNQQASIPCRIGRWAAAPGACVELTDCGPLDGRWLVATITRDLFKPDGTITLKRPQAALPEGLAPEYLATSTGTTVWAPPTSGAITPGGKYVTGGSLVQPVPKEFDLSPSPPAAKPHNTDGLAGFPAYDFMARAGSPVIAPESGTIRRRDGSTGFAGYDPALGPIGGPHGPLGWSIYLLGDSGTEYFITHLATRTCTVGEKVPIAQQIGTVADWRPWADTPDHAHVGVNGGTVTIEMLGVAPLAEQVVPVTGDAHHHR
jgi:hypothetical protein